MVLCVVWHAAVAAATTARSAAEANKRAERDRVERISIAAK
jgi:hypothetical protein